MTNTPRIDSGQNTSMATSQPASCVPAGTTACSSDQGAASESNPYSVRTSTRAVRDASRRGVLRRAAQTPAAPTFPQLTAREREILELLAAGRSNAQITGSLYLSPKTVRNNVSNVFAKLYVADRAEAIVRARDAGLGRS